MIDILFYFFAFFTVAFSAVVLFTKNIIYAAFSLVVVFLCIAVLYVLAGAEFLAITQIMIYVGGIVVLLIFGVMLTNRISGKAMIAQSQHMFMGTVVGVSLSALLIYGIYKINFPILVTAPYGQEHNNVNQLGIGLMSDYILPFEVAAILLLVALIGAATVAGYKEKSNDS